MRYGFSNPMGSPERIADLEQELRKQIAVRDNIPMLARTRRGRIGVYGVSTLGYVASLTDEAVDLLRTGSLLEDFEEMERNKPKRKARW